MFAGVGVQKSALLSKDRKYRYILSRLWQEDGRILTSILLNPSKADGETDDNTSTFMMRWAMVHGYGMLLMVNLFAFRSTDPAGLNSADDAVGPRNDYHIRQAANAADTILVGWGNNGGKRSLFVKARILRFHDLYCFGETKCGAPRFPRALGYAARLKLYRKGRTR